MSAAPRNNITSEEIRARCPQHKAAAELYASLKNAGLDYGPSFQGVQQLWCGQREALGEVRLSSPAIAPCQTNGKSDGCWIHPALLDSCMQVLAAALPEDKTASGRKWMYLPTGVATFRFLARPDARVFSHAVVRPGSNLGSEFLEADIRLLDEDGCVLAELLGFRVKLVAGDADREARENPADLLYDVAWVAKKAIVPQNKTNGSEPVCWFLLADRGGVGRALAAQLQSQGEKCIVASPEDLRELKLHVGCAKVIHLSSLDLCDPSARPDAILEAETQWVETLRFVQSLLRDSKSMKRRLWIVTRGAQAVGTASARVSLAQAPLWGLAKSIDLEHAELACTRIDLDPEGGAEELAALSEELFLPGAEREVAFRKGTRYVARLVPRSPKLSGGAASGNSARRFLPNGYFAPRKSG